MMPKKLNLKILLPTIGLDNRGGTRVNIELANRLTLRGHQVKILLPRGSNKSTFLLDPGVIIKPIGFSFPQIEDVSSIVRLLMLFPLLEPCDVVIANYYLTAYPVAFSALFNRKRLNVNLIQHYEPLAFGEAERTFPKLKRWIAETSYRFPMMQIAVADWIAKRVTKLSNLPVKVINPNYDPEIFHLPDTETQREWDTILAFPGRDIWKGWDDFTKAFQIVNRAYPHTRVRASSAMSFALPEGSYEEYHPKSDAELVNLYQTSGIYVHASWWEGFGLAPIEAMACGTPVVAAASEGILEYAVDGENCLLVPPKDPEALAGAILRLLRDRELHQKLIEGGLETVKRFAWPKMVDEFEEFLLACIAKNGKQG